MKIADARFWAAILLIAGTLAIIGALVFVRVPEVNKDMLLSLLGAWSLGLGLMLKRLFEGSDGSEIKNQTIARQAEALAPTKDSTS